MRGGRFYWNLTQEPCGRSQKVKRKVPRLGGSRCHLLSDNALSPRPNERGSLDHARHAQDLVDDEEEEDEDCPDEVFRGGFDRFACHGSGGRLIARAQPLGNSFSLPVLEQ